MTSLFGAVRHLPVPQSCLCLRLYYLVHSKHLQSGLWTSSDLFGFSLTLLAVLFKPRDGLADTMIWRIRYVGFYASAVPDKFLYLVFGIIAYLSVFFIKDRLDRATYPPFYIRNINYIIFFNVIRKIS